MAFKGGMASNGHSERSEESFHYMIFLPFQTGGNRRRRHSERSEESFRYVIFPPSRPAAIGGAVILSEAKNLSIM